MRNTTTLKLRHRQNHFRRFMMLQLAIALRRPALWAIATAILVICTQLQAVVAQTTSVSLLIHNLSFLSRVNYQEIAPTPDFLVAATDLPTPKTHPLPTTLVQWQDNTSAGDYFSEIKLTPVGYLVWSHFPLKIYVERPTTSPDSSASFKRFQNWVNAVLQGVREWSVYLPLEVVTQSENADILVWRVSPPLQTSFDPETGKLNQLRARSAQTRYEFYLRKPVNAAESVLSQRFTIQLSPDQTLDYTIATARHEIGHALGIWGHSPLETDTMYYSQVRNPPTISTRDINTLKRIYEQPTRLGWSLLSKSSFQE